MNNKYSFKDLLYTKIEIDFDNQTKVDFSKIEIPMIQRDYAQGRKVEFKLNETGKRFIDTVFSALKKGHLMEMDFVYGSVSENLKEHTFTPLDGQQRLTTLFLLYWYVGSRELKEEQYSDLMISLDKFTYSTRSSSRRFCKFLCETKLSFDKLPSTEIKNLFWFFKSYEKDPTIKAMLNMLDAIHERYSEDIPLYRNLENLQFYILPLNGFNLTEDLYIKMNARGKQLTDFENFKADLTKWMKDETNPEKSDFKKEVEYHGRKMPYYLAFSQKLDNEWTNYFWNIAKNNEVKVVDSLFMRFFYRYFLNFLIIKADENDENIEKSNDFQFFYNNDAELKFESFEIYESLLSFDNVKKIEKVFDTICEKHFIIEKSLTPSWEKDKKWTFYDVDINQRQRIIFLATTTFIEENKDFDDTKYIEWMRIVWNIIIDPNIRRVSTMINALKFIKSLSIESKDIINFLANYTGDSKQFTAQFGEEVLKAKLITSNNLFEEKIIYAESHKLFKGNIQFLLTEYENTTFETFNKNINSAVAIFKNNDLNDKAENYLWVRATLAEAEKIKLPITLSNGQFDNWRYLINSSLMSAFRSLMTKINDSDRITDIMETICENYSRKENLFWVYPLVHFKNLLENSSSSRKIQEYNYYGWDLNNVYLYQSDKWSSNWDNNILLSNYRNEIIARLLEIDKIKYSGSDWTNIQGKYFRGWDISLSRVEKINGQDIKVYYGFDRKFLKVGIKETEELKERFSDVKFEDAENGWICIKKLDYLQAVKSDEDIDGFLNEVEDSLKDLLLKLETQFI